MIMTQITSAAIPLRYTVHEQPSYEVVSSHALWSDPAREAEQVR